MASFTDRSTECAICLGSLNSSNDNADDNEDDDGGGNSSSSSSRSTTGSNTQTHNEKVITLGCGHRYHLACIISQIEVGSMKAQNDDQRLLFSSIQCAQCGRIFHDDEHPELLPTELIRATDRRRAEVDRLLLAHNLVSLLPAEPPPRGATAATAGVAAAAVLSAPAAAAASISAPATSRHHHHKHTPWDEREREARFREARRKYAFYLCSHCDRVYFGGTVACADGIPPPQSAAVTNHRPEQRLCPACVPQAHSISSCTNPVDHGQYLTWKCRYCCHPATHVCYGGVHFCDACHANNSQRVAMAERYDTNAHHHRPRLEAIPCPGNACPYPKPSNTNTNTNDATAVLFHTNGASQDCEQVYSCAICDSSSLFENNASRYSPGSYNFLYNPNGEFGVQGWKRTSRNHRMWQVEQRRQYRHEQQSEQHQINNTNHTTGDYIPEEPVLYVVSENNNDGANTNNTNSTTNNNNNNNTDRIPITTNFVSSFTDCVMMQSIDLSRVLRLDNTNTTTTTNTDISNLTPSLSSNNDEHEEVNSMENENHHNEEENEAETAGVINDATIIPIEISARYTGRDDCPSVFMLQAILSDGTMHTNSSSSSSGSGQEGRHDRLRTTDRLTSGILEAPPGNYWERTSLTFRVSLRQLKTTFHGRPIITVIVYGKDTRFWQGNFGSKVADLSVRVLGNSTFLETVVVPAAVAVPAPSISARDGAMVANNATVAVVGHTTIYKRLLWDFLVPVAIFTVLAWLARE